MHGNCLTEQAGQGAALRARAVTFGERRKTEKMPEGLLQERASVALEPTKVKMANRFAEKVYGHETDTVT